MYPKLRKWQTQKLIQYSFFMYTIYILNHSADSHSLSVFFLKKPTQILIICWAAHLNWIVIHVREDFK